MLFLDTDLNPSPNPDAVVVSSFSWLCKIDTKEPFMLILNVCINKDLAGTDSPEFQVHIPATKTFHSCQHQEMLKKFRTGEPFVMVKLENLVVHSYVINKTNYYFGNADNFKVI